MNVEYIITFSRGFYLAKNKSRRAKATKNIIYGCKTITIRLAFVPYKM